jgi:hypothetical protein
MLHILNNGQDENGTSHTDSSKQLSIFFLFHRPDLYLLSSVLRECIITLGLRDFKLPPRSR